MRIQGHLQQAAGPFSKLPCFLVHLSGSVRSSTEASALASQQRHSGSTLWEWIAAHGVGVSALVRLETLFPPSSMTIVHHASRLWGKSVSQALLETMLVERLLRVLRSGWEPNETTVIFWGIMNQVIADERAPPSEQSDKPGQPLSLPTLSGNSARDESGSTITWLFQIIWKKFNSAREQELRGLAFDEVSRGSTLSVIQRFIKSCFPFRAALRK